MMIQSLHGQENYVTINNCIFSNSISMTGTVSNGDFPAKPGQEVRYNEIRWTGNNYIYNWKQIDEIRLDIIPRGLMKNERYDSILESVNGKLSECARMSFGKGMNDDLIVEWNGEQYVNVGIFFMGYWAPVNPILNKDRADIHDGTHLVVEGKTGSFRDFYINPDPIAGLRAVLDQLLDLEEPSYMLTNLNDEGVFNTAPGESYKLNEKTYAILRGETK